MCSPSSHWRAKEKICPACRERRKISSAKQNAKTVEYRAKYREDRREKYREYNKEYYQKNREKLLEKSKQYHKNNPDVCARKSQRRRADKANTSSEKYTLKDVLEKYGTVCHMCGEEIDMGAPRRVGLPGWERGLQLDHVIPLVNGGTDTLENVKPAHGICNIKKGYNRVRK